MSDDGPDAFQDTISRIDREARPEGVVTFLFDLLHVDGDDLLDRRSSTRRQARCDRAAAEDPAVVTSDPAEARVLDEALAAGHEGVVVKERRRSTAPAAAARPGAR